MSSAKNAHAQPPPIVALPSMSSHLFSLPQAKTRTNLPIHPSQSAQRHAESEAKLKKVLERNVANSRTQQQPSRPLLPPPTYSEPSSPSQSSPIMMRPRQKPPF